MPINIPDSLPAAKILESENIFVMTEKRAMSQDIRPLKILLLNLMPKKIETETQILRLLSNSPIQVDIELMQMASHQSKNTPSEHLLKFYKVFSDVKDHRFDGLIITGAPIETLDFEDVDYIDELYEIMDWAQKNVFSTFHICWGAQAGLYHHYGIPKYPLSQKMFGLFHHKVLEPHNTLMRGFDETFFAPHSRHTEIRREDIDKCDDLVILAESDEAGVYIVASKDERQFFVTGHSEYDRETLANEYFRDVNKGLDIALPANYFPGGNPALPPPYMWRSHAYLLYANWLNFIVYQMTPYDLRELDNL